MFYRVLGLMSGTSLDGLDLAYCYFDIDGDKCKYDIICADTIAYSPQMKDFIIACEHCDAQGLSYADYRLGEYFGTKAREFIEVNKLEVDFIASHGQTIFHQPSKGFTTQIGNISALASKARHTVVGDFRAMDVALGGQGAPLVPIGDKLLFSSYANCLNLGGFSNISFDKDNERIAFDICPTNMVLNYIASMMGLPYDKDGEMARQGRVDELFLNAFNSLPLYNSNERQSLGKEWVNENIFPLINNYPIEPKDLMATYLDHITTQLAKNICGDTLLTGGGAKNKFLVESLRSKTTYNIIIPDELTIDYKEALIFAFLGVRRMRGEINCLKSVTKASQDSCSGVVAYWNRE